MRRGGCAVNKKSRSHLVPHRWGGRYKPCFKNAFRAAPSLPHNARFIRPRYSRSAEGHHRLYTMFQPPTKRLVELRNGDLLNIAEGEGYEVLVSTDTSLKYQQNLSGRRIGIVVLLTTSWHPTSHFPPEVSAVDAAVAGSYTEVEIPYAEGE
jgi:hypothetical protein